MMDSASIFIEPITTKIIMTNEASRANEENRFSIFTSSLLLAVSLLDEITVHPLGLCVNTKKRPKPPYFLPFISQGGTGRQLHEQLGS